MKHALKGKNSPRPICILTLIVFITSCAGVAPNQIKPVYSKAFHSCKTGNDKIPVDIILDVTDMKITGDDTGDTYKYYGYVRSKVPYMLRSSLAESFKSVSISDEGQLKNEAKPIIKINEVHIKGNEYYMEAEKDNKHKNNKAKINIHYLGKNPLPDCITEFEIEISIDLSLISANGVELIHTTAKGDATKNNLFLARPLANYYANNPNIFCLITLPIQFAAGCGDFVLMPCTLYILGNASRPINIKSAIKEATSKAYNNLAEQLDGREYATAFDSIIQDQTAPPALTASIVFSDAASFLPNNTIDASEKSAITVKIQNNGKGAAFGVTLAIDSEARDIDIPETIYVGDIPPGGSRDVTVPVTADAKLASGTAAFTIKANEKRRGFSARPVRLEIPTASMQRPDLMIADCKVNDASGLARGNGNMTPENNETIELETFIQNTGVGNALNVNVSLTDVTPGIKLISPSDSLAAIGPNSTSKAALAFLIPRTFAEKQIKYTITATDTRGISTKKTFTIPFTPQAPKLYLTYQVINDRGEQVPGLENGQDYRIKIIPKNAGNNLAKGVRLRLNTESNKVSIGSFNDGIGELGPNEIAPAVTVPFSLDRSFQEKTLTLHASLDQESFPGLSKTITLPVMVRKPELKYQVTLMNGVSKDAVSQNSMPRFRVSVSNTGSLAADDVSVDFQVNRPDINFSRTQTIGTIQPGESQYRDFQFFVRGDTKPGDLPVKINIAQADFNSLNPSLTFAVKEQTAVVQRVQGSGSGINQAAASAYIVPPEVYVNSPNNNTETMDEVIPLHGSIISFGTGNALDDFKVYLNRQPLKVVSSGKSGSFAENVITRIIDNNKLIFDGKVALRSGKNTIRIEGRDRNNKTCSQTLTVNKRARLGDIYAVVIGISNFGNSDYNLRYAASDAEKFYGFLKSEKGGGLPDNRLKLLTNHQANRKAVINTLTRFLGRTTRDDIAEIYLATHGVAGPDGRLYYLCYDTDVDDLRATGFSDKDLTDILNTNVNASKVILYLDACHAGMSGLSQRYAKRGIAVYEVNEKINNLAVELSKLSQTGVATFSATSSNGYSYEDNKWNGGVFTYCLIQGLTGTANTNNDEWVTIKELDTYLVRRILDITNGEQCPKINSTLPEDETPLAKVK